MELPHQSGYRGQALIRVHICRLLRLPGHMALQIAEHLLALAVQTEVTRRPTPAARLEEMQQCRDEVRPI
ncbi:hypothetical protein GCM10010431_26940 [Streptomyces kunmingensis]